MIDTVLSEWTKFIIDVVTYSKRQLTFAMIFFPYSCTTKIMICQYATPAKHAHTFHTLNSIDMVASRRSPKCRTHRQHITPHSRHSTNDVSLNEHSLHIDSDAKHTEALSSFDDDMTQNLLDPLEPSLSIDKDFISNSPQNRFSLFIFDNRTSAAHSALEQTIISADHPSENSEPPLFS